VNHDRREHRNLWALTVLCLLREGPLYPYEMQRLIHQRHKDKLLELRRGSLYHAIEQLQRAGLIQSVETRRAGRRPEHTTYRLTRAGADEVVAWLREILARPMAEPSPFLAAVSYLSRLTPEDVLAALRERMGALEAELADLETTLQGGAAERNPVLQALRPQITRVVLLENEYLRALRRAELEWVRALIEDLECGRLTWRFEEIVQKVRSSTQETTSE
jgi:DNA-binding PadR family transcriptional regulator